MYLEKTEKKRRKMFSGATKNKTSQTPTSAPHLKGGLGILDMDTQINSNQDLALFRQTQVRRSTRHNNLRRKKDNGNYLYSCLMLG